MPAASWDTVRIVLNLLAATRWVAQPHGPRHLLFALPDLSPFNHVPKLPGGEVTATPLVWLVAGAATLVAVGLAGFRRRDIEGS